MNVRNKFIKSMLSIVLCIVLIGNVGNYTSIVSASTAKGQERVSITNKKTTITAGKSYTFGAKVEGTSSKVVIQ